MISECQCNVLLERLKVKVCMQVHELIWGRVQTPGYVPKKTVVFFGYTHLKKPTQKTHTSILT